MSLPETADYELRGAVLRTARKDYECDVFRCGRTIAAGCVYAYLSHGLRWCGAHFTIEPKEQDRE